VSVYLNRFMISLLPAGDESTASSRLRVYTFARELAHRGIAHAIGPRADATIVIVQKRVTEEILHYVESAKDRGAKIIYDVDDLGDVLWWWAPKELFLRILNISDALVTATDEQAASLMDKYRVSKPYVIASPIDYFPECCAPHSESPSSPLRILWFGNGSNFNLIKKYLPALPSIPDSEVVVCTEPSLEEDLRKLSPKVRFVPWTLAHFVETLRSCHITCLMHDGDQEDRAKANTRMVTSIAWGVPACVSKTPSYFRTARECDVEDFVFANEEELVAVINKLRPRAKRVEYLTKAQPCIWSLYAPSATADRYLALLKKVAG
jgi:hypothetical protein